MFCYAEKPVGQLERELMRDDWDKPTVHKRSVTMMRCLVGLLASSSFVCGVVAPGFALVGGQNAQNLAQALCTILSATVCLLSVKFWRFSPRFFLFSFAIGLTVAIGSYVGGVIG